MPMRAKVYNAGPYSDPNVAFIYCVDCDEMISERAAADHKKDGHNIEVTKKIVRNDVRNSDTVKCHSCGDTEREGVAVMTPNGWLCEECQKKASNEVPEDEKQGLIVAMSEPAKKVVKNALADAVKNGYATAAAAAKLSDKDGYPQPVPIWFIHPGLVHYEYLNNGSGATVLVDKPALDKMLPSIVGKPIINRDHRDVSPDDFKNGGAAGIICGDPVYDSTKGMYRCDALIWDDETRTNIENGYSVSCEYGVTKWGDGGVHNNIPYEKEVLDGEYRHIAIVANPRYERARIMNSQGGNTMLKMLQWLKKGNDDIRNSVEVDPAKTHIEIDGQEVVLANAVEAYRESEKAKAAVKARADAEAAAALEKAKNALSDDATIQIDGKAVKVADLKNAYAEKIKNAEEDAMKKDHKDGEHKDKELDNCPMCNASDDDEDDAKKKKDKDEADEKAKNAHNAGAHTTVMDNCAICQTAAAEKLHNAAMVRTGKLSGVDLRTDADGLKEGAARYGTAPAK